MSSQYFSAVKPTQSKNLVSNAYRFTYQNLKSCKPIKNESNEINYLLNAFRQKKYSTSEREKVIRSSSEILQLI